MGQVDLQRHCIGARHRTPARLPYIKHIVESSFACLARQNEPEEPRRHLAASPADHKAALAPSVAAEATTYQRPSTQISASQQLVSSGVGAILTSLTMTPFDVVKTRLQAQNQPNMTSCYNNLVCDYILNPEECAKCGRQRISFNNTMDAFIKIGRSEGLPSLWRGMYPTLVMSVPGTVIYFTSYDWLRNAFNGVSYAASIAGAVSRVFAASMVSPLELIRTKMQASAYSSYPELWSVIRGTMKSEGPLVLWRGLGPTLMRDVPFSAIYWLGYEKLRVRLGMHYYGASFDVANPPMSVAFVAGASSGMFAALVTQPFDVIKTRQQSLLGERFGGVHQPQGETTAFIIRDIFRSHGVRGLWTGIVPRLAKISPACAIMISTYEGSKKFFRNRNYNRS